MSQIPNSAMPHARAEPEARASDGRGEGAESRLGRLAVKAREYPKTAAAAGAALVAGVAAAAAIPVMRARGRGGEAKGPAKSAS